MASSQIRTVRGRKINTPQIEVQRDIPLGLALNEIESWLFTERLKRLSVKAPELPIAESSFIFCAYVPIIDG
jgi:hypothetical protein